MRKKVDSRIKTLIENCLKLRQRGIFVIIGDRGRDQVVNMHYLMTKMTAIQRMKVLWCYKKELGFSSHKKKRMQQIKTQMKQGLYDTSIDEPFDLFISASDIRYCYYSETQNILGNTYDMLVLQDFESLTPNTICRTVETVQGGGIVFLLLKNMTSLKQLYTMSMDVHKKYRTDAHNEVEPRFNERFILSLATCKNCLFMDDEMNLLPINSSVNTITPISKEEAKFYETKDSELTNLKNS
jgi:N-acetyltransferase 10